MSKKFELSVPFGTDIHSVILTEKELEKVQSGKSTLMEMEVEEF